MKKYMENVNTFKSYLTRSNMLSDIREYVKDLDNEKLNWFYNQCQEPLKFLTDEGYLFYKFRWIRNHNFNDLSKEIFIESLCNPEGIKEPIVKEEWNNLLYKRYEKDIQELYDCMKNN